jgi:hypothetical protein
LPAIDGDRVSHAANGQSLAVSQSAIVSQLLRSLSLSLSLSLFLSLPRGNRLVEKRNLEFRARVHFVIAETREKAPAKPNASPFIASLLISSLLAFAFSLLLLCLCQAVTAVARQRIDQPFRKCFLSDALQGESSYGVHDGTMDHFAGNQAHCGHRAQYFTRLIN